MWSNYGKGKDITQPISTPYGMVDPLEKNIPPVPLADQLKGVVDADDSLARTSKAVTMLGKLNPEGRKAIIAFWKDSGNPDLVRLAGVIDTLPPDALDEPADAPTKAELWVKDFLLKPEEERAAYWADIRSKEQGIAGAPEMVDRFITLEKGWDGRSISSQGTLVGLLERGSPQDKELAEHFRKQIGRAPHKTYTEKEQRDRDTIAALKKNPRLYTRYLMKQIGITPDISYERAFYRAGQILEDFTAYLETKRANEAFVELVSDENKDQAKLLAEMGPSPLRFFEGVDDEGMVSVGGKKIPITRDILGRIIHKSMQDPALQGFEADFIKSLQGNKEGK